ncbi:hypothetical protein POSPLADRAFT_1041838 [Postia placenta MAD-698-R-SB12]|uniref:Uncharacterized protein n=1 Tax=Postia placenta MAD-698-R-SB12 TaxID=670580 RepID=A0A1X6MKX3_9APHY|nr:hypothetical protein POSPLADRAFT_1041838 [Postia placenta MAD-698-R-SB12]OSX57044.1 hypothetical protein POSPLADRAFT_1041838 [Postia placenta MAD-698-R-SB12]
MSDDHDTRLLLSPDPSDIADVAQVNVSAKQDLKFDAPCHMVVNSDGVSDFYVAV